MSHLVSARHPSDSFPVNLSLKLSKAVQSQPPSRPCFGPPLFMAYKWESSAGDITIDVCQGFFPKYAMMPKMQRAGNIYI